MREKALLVGAKRSLVSILTPAENDNGNLVVLIMNAGLIHHVGPSRLSVHLARRLASDNIASIRFDMSNIGDSSARADHLSVYDLVVMEPIEVMNDLQARGFKRFVLLGICSGAYAAFHAAAKDPRVTGAIMINPEDLGGKKSADMSDAWAQRYWKKSLFSAKAWANLLTGKVNYRRLTAIIAGQAKKRLSPKRGVPESAATASVQQILTDTARRTKLLFVSAQTDVSVEYVASLLNNLPTSAQNVSSAAQGQKIRNIESMVIQDTDHLFTHTEAQKRLINALCLWLKTLEMAAVE